MNSPCLKKLRNYLLIMAMAGIVSGCSILSPRSNFERVNGGGLFENQLVMTISLEKGYDDRGFGEHVSDVKKTSQRFFQVIFPIEAGKTNQAQSVSFVEEIKNDSDMELLPTADFDRVLESQFIDLTAKITMWGVNSKQPIGSSYFSEQSAWIGSDPFILSESSLFMATKADGFFLTDLKTGNTEKVENWKSAAPFIEAMKRGTYHFKVTDDGRYLVGIPDPVYAIPSLIYDRDGQDFKWSSSIHDKDGDPIPVVKVQSINGELYFLCKKTVLNKDASGLGRTTLFLETQKHTIIGSTASNGRIFWDPKNNTILFLPMTIEFSPKAFIGRPKIWHYREGKEEFVDFDIDDALRRMSRMRR